MTHRRTSQALVYQPGTGIKWLILALALVITMLVLAACGNDNSTTAAPTTAATTTAPATTAPTTTRAVNNPPTAAATTTVPTATATPKPASLPYLVIGDPSAGGSLRYASDGAL